MDGHIPGANDAFLALMGDELAEIRGKHHPIFAEPQEAQGAGYKSFWPSLRMGEHHARVEMARIRAKLAACEPFQGHILNDTKAGEA